MLATTMAIHQAPSSRPNSPRATKSSVTPSKLTSVLDASTIQSGTVVLRMARRVVKAGVAPEISITAPLAKVITPK